MILQVILTMSICGTNDSTPISYVIRFFCTPTSHVFPASTQTSRDLYFVRQRINCPRTSIQLAAKIDAAVNATSLCIQCYVHAHTLRPRARASRILVILLQGHDHALVKPLPKLLVLQIISKRIKITMDTPSDRFCVIAQFPFVYLAGEPHCYREFCHAVLHSLVV